MITFSGSSTQTRSRNLQSLDHPKSPSTATTRHTIGCLGIRILWRSIRSTQRAWQARWRVPASTAPGIWFGRRISIVRMSLGLLLAWIRHIDRARPTASDGLELQSALMAGPAFGAIVIVSGTWVESAAVYVDGRERLGGKKVRVYST